MAFKNGDTILGCWSLKIHFRHQHSHHPAQIHFCGGHYISTIVAEDLATEDTACTVILAEERDLLAY